MTKNTKNDIETKSAEASATSKGRGRKKNPELKGDLIVLHVQFPTRFLQALDTAADEMAQSRSGLVRQLIMQYLKENDYLSRPDPDAYEAAFNKMWDAMTPEQQAQFQSDDYWLSRSDDKK